MIVQAGPATEPEPILRLDSVHTYFYTDLGIARAEVGRAADAMDIRIRGCQLGCF